MLDKDSVVNDNRLYEGVTTNNRKLIMKCIDDNINQACYLPTVDKAVNYILRKIQNVLNELDFVEPNYNGDYCLIVEDKYSGKEFWSRLQGVCLFHVLSPEDFSSSYSGASGVTEVLKRVKPINKYVVMPDCKDIYISAEIVQYFSRLESNEIKYVSLIKNYISFDGCL